MATSFPVNNTYVPDEILETYGMPLRSKIANLTSATYAGGAAVVGFSPTIGQRLRIKTFYIYSSAATQLDLYANGNASTLGYTFWGTRANLVATEDKYYPVGQWVTEGQSIGAVAVNSFTAQISASLSGYRLSGDNNYGARSKWLHIGDSLTNTTVLNASPGDTFYHGYMARKYQDDGGDVYRAMKGEGGMNSTQMYSLLYGYVLNVPQANVITYMMGTNDSGGLSQFQTTFDQIILWKKRYYPNALFVGIGPPWRNDGQEANLVLIRQYMQTTIGGLDSKFKYFNFGDASLIPHNLTAYPDGVHFTAFYHNVAGSALYEFVKNDL